MSTTAPPLPALPLTVDQLDERRRAAARKADNHARAGRRALAHEWGGIAAQWARMLADARVAAAVGRAVG